MTNLMCNDRQQHTIVLGGAGFIGSHLCRMLLKEGRHVLCIDNLSTGSLSNISSLFANPSFRFLRHDITQPFPSEVSQIEFLTEIYNLACPASPLRYQQDSVHTLLTSVIGSINALNLASYTGSRILLASTSEVYGDPEISPQSEDYHGSVNTTGPRSCYDEGKRAAETLFSDYYRQYGTDTRIIRIFNTYGPNMDSEDGRVIPTFINQALHGMPLTINGDGSQTRSFMYISDLLSGIRRVMDADIPALPVNLGNPEEVSINQLADIILQITGSNSEVSYRPLPIDDPLQRCPDIVRAQKLLKNWQPTISIERGLRLTIESTKLH